MVAQHPKPSGNNAQQNVTVPQQKRLKSKSRERNGQGHLAIQIGNGQSNERVRRPKMVRLEKPRQEICAPLKWSCFLINFVIFLASVACLALGLYLFVNDPRPVAELADFVLNPAVLLASVGLISGVVTLFGLFGALRDNVFLLKLFALCVFLAYLFLVICTCLLFLLFYSDATGDSKGISAQSVLLHSISRYHANKNVADFIDYLQEQLECCGSTTFRDWQFSEQFNCNATNPYPEKCGVPFSCCRRSVVSEAGTGGRQNPLAPAIRSIRCWQNAQKKREQELDSDIYVAGCLQPLRALFDSHALHIGLAVVSVILPVCLGVCLSQCLARQIDYQHFLLRREKRRLDRRERRERRYREQCEPKGPQRKKTSISSQSELMERGEVQAVPMGERRRRSPPKIPPPPTPRNDAEAAALAAAIKASKQEFEKEQQRRRQHGQLAGGAQIRAASFSPLRNVAIKKESEEKAKKRKSMTLDTAEQQLGRKKKIEPKKASKAGEKDKKTNNKEAALAKQQKRNSQLLVPAGNAVQQQVTGCSKMNVRVEPSAPPMFLTLQQHHFN